MPSISGPVTPVLALSGGVAPIPVESPSAVLEGDLAPYTPSGRDEVDVQVMVLDRYRRPLSELRPVVVKPVRRTRTGVAINSVLWPSDAYGGDKLVDIDRSRFHDRARELQVFRAGRPVAGGPVMRHERGPDGMIETTFTDPRQYLSDRTHGSAERENLLRNPNGEAGTAWWTAVDCTATVVDTLLGPEPRAFRLTGSSSAASFYQIRRLPTSDDPAGNSVTAVYWYKLASNVAFPAFGLGMQAKVFVDGAEDVSLRQQAIIETRGPWTRLEVAARQEPDAVVEIEVRLWAPNGAAILWTGGQLVYRENTGVGEGGDVTTLVATVLREVGEDAALNWEYDSTLSGETFEAGFAYNDYEAGNCLDAVRDWEHVVDCIPTIPSRGRVRWLIGPPDDTPVLALGPDTTTALTVTQDAAEAASFVRLRGDESGVAREEGTAYDPTLADGLRIDKVEDAADGTPIRNLASGAEAILARYHRAALHVTGGPRHDGYARTSGALVHTLRPGQVVTMIVPIAGEVTAEVAERIEAMEWDPATDTLTLTELSEVVT